MNDTWCPQCGPGVPCDEDGCCQACGADCKGPGADRALAVLAAKEALRVVAEVERLRARVAELERQLAAETERAAAWEREADGTHAVLAMAEATATPKPEIAVVTSAGAPLAPDCPHPTTEKRCGCGRGCR